MECFNTGKLLAYAEEGKMSAILSLLDRNSSTFAEATQKILVSPRKA